MCDWNPPFAALYNMIKSYLDYADTWEKEMERSSTHDTLINPAEKKKKKKRKKSAVRNIFW